MALGPSVLKGWVFLKQGLLIQQVSARIPVIHKCHHAGWSTQKENEGAREALGRYPRECDRHEHWSWELPGVIYFHTTGSLPRPMK